MKKLIMATAISMFALSTSVTAATTIRIGHGANETFHLHRALEKFKEDVETKSDGELKVQIFANSQMGPDREMIEGVQSGMLQMAVSPSSFYSSWDPAFDVVELPFIYPSKQAAFDTVYSPTGDKLLSRLNRLNLQGLGWMESGVRHVSNSARAINTPDDLKGLKIRTMKVPAHVKTFNSLNASATPMNFGEVYSGLQQGVVDGQENPIAQIYAQRFYEVQDYVSLTGHVVTFYIPVMNLDFWHSLSQQHQQVITASMRDAEAYQQELVMAEETAQLETFIKHGTQVNSLSEEQLQLFIDSTEPVRQEYRKKVGADIYDAWMSQIQDVTSKS
ncbi:TRAP transporter substrate-binding protein [Vibrio cyclitrophicus]|uniref:TRAP transporter substrate-binding protein n=1 Tax=Vibrio cyclitrophicus TaxID=47951 RepID=UPI0011B4B7CB|nr:TRAP transporter substrate-binding protein [Vibrio cyclitrophicus]